MKNLVLAAFLGSATFAAPALAADDCACGEAGCEKACTCSSGICDLHAGHGKGMGGGKGMMGGKGMGGKGMMMGERPVFDTTTMVTITGTVKEVVRQPHGPGFVGLHLKTMIGDELVTVHLGPSDFVEPKLNFAVGDTFEATGSRMTFKGTPTMLTTVVKKGTQSLELRGADGTPKFRAPPGK